MEPIRVGVVGAGWVACNRHLPALRQLPEADLRLIWSRDEDKARSVAAEFGVAGVVKQWQEVVESAEVDAVIIATPPVLHLPGTAAALHAGKHVLCQARMARNLSEAREMLRLARATSLVTALYPPRPGLKGDRVMQRLLHEQAFVGDILEVRVTAMALAPEKHGYSWANDPAVVGVNAMTLGMWAEVLDRWVGPAVRVMAMAKNHCKLRETPAGDWAEASVPDSLAIAADLQCGATATYHFSTHAAFGPGHAIEIYGSQGALVYRLFGDEILGASAGSTELEPIAIPPGEERFQDTDAAFMQAIREGTTVSPGFEEGLRYMEFSEAVALSVRTGAAVSMPPSQPAMDAWGQLLDESQKAT